MTTIESSPIASAPPTQPGKPRRRWWLAITVSFVVCALVLLVGLAFARTYLSKPLPVLSSKCVAKGPAGSSVLTPEQTANAALIAAMGRQEAMPAQATVIALATAIQESSLRNIRYGDRDSLGLFQQRPSQGWGSVDEVMDPLYSSRTFYRALAGIPGFESMPVTAAAQAVQRSAFPNAYAQHENMARNLTAAFIGEPGAELSCSLTGVLSEISPAQGSSLESLKTAAHGQWGNEITVQGDAAARVARLSAVGTEPPPAIAQPNVGTALAHWAVAHAEAFGLTSVRVGDRIWRKADSDRGWVHDESASVLQPNQVELTF